MLVYENSRNPHTARKQAIERFLRENVSSYIDADRAEEVREKAGVILATGVKTADAFHVACAILSGSDIFVTTDDRLLRYQTGEIKIVSPPEFIRLMEEEK